MGTWDTGPFDNDAAPDGDRSAVRFPLTRLLAAAALTAAAGGCEKPLPEPLAVPCPGTPASRVELGRPSILLTDPATKVPPTAQFTTPGGPVHVLAHNFGHGDIFGDIAGLSTMYVGPVGTPPSVDTASSKVTTTVTATVDVEENAWKTQTLPAGRYWLVNGDIADIAIVSCDGTLTGRAAPRSDDRTPSSPPAQPATQPS